MAYRSSRFSRHPVAFAAERGARASPVLDREPVREELLRTKAARTIDLSCWRGRSGRRYVVVLYPVRRAAEIDPSEAVVIAVARPPAGPARILAAGHRGSIGQALATWIPLGTDELHVHRSGLTAMRPDAIIRDLIDAG